MASSIHATAPTAYYLRERAKMTADGKKPTYPVGAFCYFYESQKPGVKATHKGPLPKVKLQKILRRKWKDLVEKDPYREMARQDYVNYLALMEEWRQLYGEAGGNGNTPKTAQLTSKVGHELPPSENEPEIANETASQNQDEANIAPEKCAESCDEKVAREEEKEPVILPKLVIVINMEDDNKAARQKKEFVEKVDQSGGQTAETAVTKPKSAGISSKPRSPSASPCSGERVPSDESCCGSNQLEFSLLDYEFDFQKEQNLMGSVESLGQLLYCESSDGDQSYDGPLYCGEEREEPATALGLLGKRKQPEGCSKWEEFAPASKMAFSPRNKKASDEIEL